MNTRILNILACMPLAILACSSHSKTYNQINRHFSQCSPHQPQDTTMSAYASKPLYFHYFSIDIPQDINTDNSINQTSFWGNRFHAYPIKSQKAFTDLVESRIAVFANHKISDSAKAYERKKYKTLEKLNLQERKKDHPQLNMVTALYKVHKFDEQHYRIIANPLSNLNSTYNNTMYSQWYIYFPKQHKYIMTKQTPFPARFLLEKDKYATGQKFLDKNIRPLSTENLADPTHMAVGPIAWINPDSHPIIDYQLNSEKYPMSIQLETDGYLSDGMIKSKQTARKNQLKEGNQGKARHLDSGSKTVAGMKGREVCYYYPLTEYSESAYIWCSWGTNGRPKDLNNPFIYLNMFYNVDGSEASRKKAMQAWEQLLSSLKKRGGS